MDRAHLRTALAKLFSRRLRPVDEQGVTAIEFALVVTPFFIMIFGLVEVCLIIFMSSMLEFGTSQASRNIRTGIFQANGQISEQQLRSEICEAASVMPDCESRLRLDVKRLSSFSEANLGTPIGPTGQFDPSGFSFDVGQGSDIVIVRAFYEWPLFTPVLTRPLANLGPDKRLLASTLVFKNEPF